MTRWLNVEMVEPLYGPLYVQQFEVIWGVWGGLTAALTEPPRNPVPRTATP
jgi:hypothetical protein